MTWLANNVAVLALCGSVLVGIFHFQGRFIRLENDVRWIKRAMRNSGINPDEPDEETQ